MRRDRFVEELEGYNKQLEEFETFGDVAEINRYLKKAQTLNSRLEAAQEKVDFKLNHFYVLNIFMIEVTGSGMEV